MKTTRFAISMIIITVGIASTAGVISYSSGIDAELNSHVDEVGHTGMIERVEGVEKRLEQMIDGVTEDVDEIKQDVKVLLHRSQ